MGGRPLRQRLDVHHHAEDLIGRRGQGETATGAGHFVTIGRRTNPACARRRIPCRNSETTEGTDVDGVRVTSRLLTKTVVTAAAATRAIVNAVRWPACRRRT